MLSFETFSNLKLSSKIKRFEVHLFVWYFSHWCKTFLFAFVCLSFFFFNKTLIVSWFIFKFAHISIASVLLFAVELSSFQWLLGKEVEHENVFYFLLKSSLLNLEHTYKTKLYFFYKNHLVIYHVLCQSLTQISKILFLIFLETAFINWISRPYFKLTIANIKTFYQQQFSLTLKQLHTSSTEQRFFFK